MKETDLFADLKWLWIALPLVLTACDRKPDNPVQQVAESPDDEPPLPLPPPASRCLGVTTPWSVEGTSYRAAPRFPKVTIPGFDLECGDSLRVYLQTITPVIGVPCVPGPVPECVVYGPWVEILRGPGYIPPAYGDYGLDLNVVTIHAANVPTSSWNWNIQAILK